MGWNDHLNDPVAIERKCPKCGKTYLCEEYDQVPGFRSSEEEVCPYCGTVIRTSLEYEFKTYKK